MAEYFEKNVPFEVSAVQWSLGESVDGLVTVYGATPGSMTSSLALCPACGVSWGLHGFLPNKNKPIICNGDWIVQLPDGTRVVYCTVEFNNLFEEVV